MSARPRGDPPTSGGPGGRDSLSTVPRRGFNATLRGRVAAVLFGTILFGAGAAGSAAPATKAPTNEDCQTCHGDAEAKRADGRSVFVAEKKFAASVHGQAGLACVDCHADLAKTSDFPHKERLAPVACATCHDTVAAAHPFHPEMARADAAGAPKVACATCHGAHDTVPVKDAAFRFAAAREVAACANCHADVGKRFRASEHGEARAAGAQTLTCLSCHRKPVTAGALPDRLARKQAQETLCVSCHVRNKAVREQVSSSPSFVASYEHSVHGLALARGDARAPTCVDCHGAHDARHGFDSSSPVNKMHVEQVCGRCHENETRQYQASVHGAALRKGNKDAPACTDCHGEHAILSPKDPNSPVAAANVSARTCTPCHASVKLTDKWNLPGNRVQTFADSFHGLAARGGSVEVANCASCHGTHDILPSSNPASRIAPANLARTCGSAGCHPGANGRFGTAKVHVAATVEEDPLLYWIATLYIALIVLVVGGMFLHNVLDFARKSKHRLAVRRGEIFEPPAGRALYLRMTVGERLQHGALLVSFTLLVITGFMLRFPEASWVVLLRRLSHRSFELRSLIHRVSGVVLIAASLYHAGYVAFTSRGRQLVRDLWWRRKDLQDAIGLVRYNLGRTSEKPRLDRFSYIEKSEYWALVWGTGVMAVTGLMMWFDNTSIGLLSKLGYDVARAIHFYEAWLASLAILVWHFYFVIFNPDVYPMNSSWLTGTLSEREMEEEHPLELERLHEASRPEDGGGEGPGGVPPAPGGAA
jgi:cytochrome b subunit of formate dehydrogenase